jgi:hypothetical protein
MRSGMVSVTLHDSALSLYESAAWFCRGAGAGGGAGGTGRAGWARGCRPRPGAGGARGPSWMEPRRQPCPAARPAPPCGSTRCAPRCWAAARGTSHRSACTPRRAAGARVWVREGRGEVGREGGRRRRPSRVAGPRDAALNPLQQRPRAQSSQGHGCGLALAPRRDARPAAAAAGERASVRPARAAAHPQAVYEADHTDGDGEGRDAQEDEHDLAAGAGLIWGEGAAAGCCCAPGPAWRCSRGRGRGRRAARCRPCGCCGPAAAAALRCPSLTPANQSGSTAQRHAGSIACSPMWRRAPACTPAAPAA